MSPLNGASLVERTGSYCCIFGMESSHLNILTWAVDGPHTTHHSRQVKELTEDLGCHVLKTPPERQTQQWMREQLTYIKEQFEESELRSLARGHYSDAIKVLQEAAEQAEQQPYQSWVRM